MVIFAISLIAFGAFSTLLLILSLALIPIGQEIPGMEAVMPNGILAQPMFWLSSFLNLFIFVSWVISGVGVLHLYEWARHYLRIVMAVHIINMLVNIFLNIFLAEEALPKIPLGFLVAGIMIAFSYYLGVIYFFSHPQVVRQFKYKSKKY